MPPFKVQVKWGKEKFHDVECSTDEAPEVFRAQLFALTGVPPARQKIMLKGATLGDSWNNVKLKDGMMMMLMGSAEDLPQEPTITVKFVEDMNEEQLAEAMAIPSGLTNLGNTCYMNATIQCFRAVPELKDALMSYRALPNSAGADTSHVITKGLAELFSTMERSSQAIPPLVFLQLMHMAFPQFAERGEHGGYTQQDANECWVQMMRMIQQRLPGKKASPADPINKGLIDQFFGGKFEVTMKCLESEEEEETRSVEEFNQLSCFISQDVKYLLSGLQAKLEEKITKKSPSLDRDAQYLKSSRVSRLPAYLAVQMVRFFYKERESVNAKILKDVKFTLMLDVWELCSKDLQAKLIPQRDKFKAMEDRAQKAKMEMVETNGHKKKTTTMAPYSFPDDTGSNNSGYYNLIAVLTHKGRSSSQGHYVAWVKRKGEEWFKFDDDDVEIVHESEIVKLSGGGDWHMAYVLLYAPRELEVEEE